MMMMKKIFQHTLQQKTVLIQYKKDDVKNKFRKLENAFYYYWCIEVESLLLIIWKRQVNTYYDPWRIIFHLWRILCHFFYFERIMSQK